MSWFFERYQAGDHQQIWAELLISGSEAREDEDDHAVIAETMRRARHNVELLVEELPRLGYVFEHPDTAHVPPPDGLAERLDELETTIGVMPLALRAWFEQVGTVDLVGTHPDWPHPKPDPLQVEGEVDYWRDEFELRTEDGLIGPGEPFLVEVSADALHKADISGGPPYGIAVPNPGVDGLLYGEWHQTTFMTYVRIAFRHAGFAGYDHPPDYRDGQLVPLPDQLRELAGRLVPL